MNCTNVGQIAGLRYGFYSPDEIRRLSVRKVTNDLAFDKFTGRGVDGGLHDVNFGKISTYYSLIFHRGHWLQWDLCTLRHGFYRLSGSLWPYRVFETSIQPFHVWCIVQSKCTLFMFNSSRLWSLSALGVFAYTVQSILLQPYIYLEHQVSVSHIMKLMLLVSKLPGKLKALEIKELEGLSGDDLRQVAIRNLATRPRAPCKLCGSGSWGLRHISKQQLVLHPISIAGGNRSKARMKE